MISSNAISSHSTDVAALAACVNAASCYGISYEPSLAANVRWSARLGGEGVGLFFMSEVDSWVYSGSCRRRLAEEWADESTSVAEEPEAESWWTRWINIGDLDEHPVVKLQPARGPLLRQNAHLRI